MDTAEDRLARLRQRDERLAAELVATPWHLKGTPWELDRIECLDRTRRQIAELEAAGNRTWTATLEPRPKPEPAAPVAPVAPLTRRAELAARFYEFARKGGR
jgi:hypothetical protein